MRSNLWPGAVCACQGPRFTNVYVGWGLKNAPFLPMPPPPVRMAPSVSVAAAPACWGSTLSPTPAGLLACSQKRLLLLRPPQVAKEYDAALVAALLQKACTCAQQ